MIEDNNDAKIIADEILLYLQSKNKTHLLNEVVKRLLEKGKIEVDTVNVFSADKLTETQKQKIITKFGKICNSKKFSFDLDQSLIAGILVKYQDKIWDYSLKNNLENIKIK